MALIVLRAFGAFSISLSSKRRTKGWEALERNPQFGERKQ